MSVSVLVAAKVIAAVAEVVKVDDVASVAVADDEEPVGVSELVVGDAGLVINIGVDSVVVADTTVDEASCYAASGLRAESRRRRELRRTSNGV